MGRPKEGALSSYPLKLRNKIKSLRQNNEGWGAISILVELEDKGYYHLKNLPSPDAVHRYLKQEGFIPQKIPRGKIVEGQLPKEIKHPHDLWEMDAQGAEYVKGLGYIAMINIKDSQTKTYIMSFPVQVAGGNSQPKTNHYLWALRLGFEEFGLPKAIQVDRDSVFVDSSSKSPFPSQVQLFLASLEIELCFIDVPPPAKQAMVERSHQTMQKQVMQGKIYSNWHGLFIYTNKRRKVMNEKYPSRSLNKQAPLQAAPHAKQNTRLYEIGQEKYPNGIKRMEKVLAQFVWYRKVSTVKTLSLNCKIYYLNQATPKTYLGIRYCTIQKKILFHDVNEQLVQEVFIEDFSIQLLEKRSTEELLEMRKKIFKSKDFPL